MRNRDWKDFKDDLIHRFFEAWQDPTHHKIVMECNRWEEQRLHLYRKRWYRFPKYLGYAWRTQSVFSDIPTQFGVVIGDVGYLLKDKDEDLIQLIKVVVDERMALRQQQIDNAINDKLVAKYKKV